MEWITSFKIDIMDKLLIFYMHEIVASALENKAFGFSFLLTYIFQHFKVDFASEERDVTTTVNIIDGPLLGRCAYKYDKETKE